MLPLKDNFIKFYSRDSGFVFYVNKNHKDRIEDDPKFFSDLSADSTSNFGTIISYSDFVIDTFNNKLIKCRFGIEDILDEVTNV